MDSPTGLRLQKSHLSVVIMLAACLALPTARASDCQTGTSSEVFEGRDAQLATWRSDFESAGRAIYVRTTTCVRVSTTAPVALEVGSWRGRRDSAADFAAGSYAAKWRRVDGAWKVEAEIYVTETCGGDFCPASTGAVP